ncbi:MAG: endopeptidase La [Gammaproteobacteria bacterium RIFCSPLOWO2_12_FULL_52_10]|nr:MAG: endopeptidase La [Gammaproteobacteria bacterium RIFCSPLOWO2_12_FULL_52_10]
MKNDQQDTIIPTDSESDAHSGMPVRQDEVLTDKIYLLPISDRPFFPSQTLPIIINEKFWLETIERVGRTPQRLVGICLTRQKTESIPKPDDFSAVGTVARIHHAQKIDGNVHFIAEGIRRFRVYRWISEKEPYLVQVEFLEPPVENKDRVKAYSHAIINTIKELLPLNPIYKEQLRVFLDRFNPDDASPLADFAALLTSAEGIQLQEILETLPLIKRMEKVLLLLRKEIEYAGMQANIRQKVEAQMSDQQKDFFLRQQLKAIQQELGISKDDKTVEVELFKNRLKDLELPQEAQKRVDEEMQKFSFLELGSPEYAVTRNYLDNITALPWGKYSEDKLDLKRARTILDRDHDGLDDVKDRIIEFLAIGVQKGEISGAILLLVGPPGVGKTSIGHSIAEALGREFYRFSLGGMRDEAEIKGHRRTYIGALPGKFIQAIKDAGTSNPVIMLDEIDKIGASYQGNPASALLEVLDPEQNSEFQDHYLDLRFDLSKVLFICTANQLDTIPPPLLDRMESIHLPGYIAAEKLAIARHHLWPKQLQKAGLKSSQLKLSDAVLKRIIENYAREAGVRGLEKMLGRIIRKATVKLLKGKVKKIRIGTKELESYLGLPLFRKEIPMTGVGVVTGLAWTAMGGATLSVEATKVPTDNRSFKLTGNLGQVMQESAAIAYTYVGANMEMLAAPAGFFDKILVHLHVPEGATPKDGPSAGITMATVLLSLARNKKIRRPLAMTGELTLTGMILPVGGIREKIVAAKRARITEIILPEANRRDFEELPDFLRKDLTVHFVSVFPEVAEIVFT